MSAVIKLPNEGNAKNVYLIYDFKQVNDSILLLMYVEKLNCWKKIFVNNKDGVWDTSVLAPYTDDETFKQLCTKLEFIFSQQKHSDEENALHLDQTMQQDAEFLLGLSN